jgi:hypothetical protein
MKGKIKKSILLFGIVTIFAGTQASACCICCGFVSCAPVISTLSPSTGDNILKGHATDTTQFVLDEGTVMARYIYLIRKAIEERRQATIRRQNLQKRIALLHRYASFLDNALKRLPLAETKALNAEATLLTQEIDAAILYSKQSALISKELERYLEAGKVQR